MLDASRQKTNVTMLGINYLELCSRRYMVLRGFVLSIDNASFAAFCGCSSI
jgi:hypothetical protein